MNLSHKTSVIAVGLSLFSGSANAAKFNSACSDLSACIKAVSALTGDTYIYNEKDLKGQSFISSQDVELTPENATTLLSTYLKESALTRVPNGNKMYVIYRENDAKGMALPVFYASQTDTPSIPDNWDMVTLKYKASHPESVKHLENIIRTYANMGARIYGVEQSGYLIITDNARNVKNLISFMRENDVKVSPALQKKWDEYEKESRKARLEHPEKFEHPKPAPAPAEKK